VGQLKQLEFLDLRGLHIKDLPEDICHLSALQFLDLSNCQQLRSLPSKIGELKNLKYLNLEYCLTLRVIPHEISQLTSLNTLSTPYGQLSLEAESEASIWSLKGLGNLTTLSTGVQEGTTSSGIREGIMGTWLEMRHFCFCFSGHKDLPRDMQNMRKLQSFIMFQYHGLSLPDYTYKFHHLEYLQLWDCPHLRELSPLERLPNLKSFKLGKCSNLKELGIGNSGRASGFLMLKQLVIVNLPKLESIAGPSNHGVWNETILPNLCVLAIRECPCLNRLPKGMEKLVSLSSLFGEEDWWQRIIWEDDNMKSSLQKLFKKCKSHCTLTLFIKCYCA
jgi:Leucine-rich repeat (LRR) protein